MRAPGKRKRGAATPASSAPAPPFTPRSKEVERQRNALELAILARSKAGHDVLTADEAQAVCARFLGRGGKPAAETRAVAGPPRRAKKQARRASSADNAIARSQSRIEQQLHDDLLVTVLTASDHSSKGRLSARDLGRLSCVSRCFAPLVDSAAKGLVAAWPRRSCTSALSQRRARIGLTAGQSWLELLRDLEIYPAVRYFTTGSSQLDRALGGGIATSTITEVMGSDSTGKSVLSHMVAVTAQLTGGRSMIIDVDGTFEPVRMEPVAVRYGLNPTAALDSVLYTRVHTVPRLLQALHAAARHFRGQPLPGVLNTAAPFAALCIDSATLMYEEMEGETAKAILRVLTEICDEFHIAVLVNRHLSASLVAAAARPLQLNSYFNSPHSVFGARIWLRRLSPHDEQRVYPYHADVTEPRAIDRFECSVIAALPDPQDLTDDALPAVTTAVFAIAHRGAVAHQLCDV